MSLQINLPSLHKGITVSKDAAFDDPKQYVCVRGRHAIVMSGWAIVVFDLESYFTDYEEIADDENQYLEALLDWLEGKNFTKSFWNEIAGLKTITVIDDSTIKIDSESFSQNVTYFHRAVLTDGILKRLNENAKHEALAYPTVAYSNRCFEFIQKTVGKYIGNSSLVIEFVRKEKPARFTVNNKPYIFGIIEPNHEATEAAFIFEALTNYCDENPVE